MGEAYPSVAEEVGEGRTCCPGRLVGVVGQAGNAAASDCPYWAELGH